MPLSTLLDELVLTIAESLNTESDVNSLAQCARRFYNILNPYLYFYVQQQDRGEATLIWAAKRGREGTARLLLQVDQSRGGGNINPNCTDSKYGISALSWAAAKGHKAVIQVLLESKEISPNLVSNRRTALSHAAEHGHVGVMKLLLTNNNGHVDPDARDSSKYLRTPLMWAGSPRATEAIEENTEEDLVRPSNGDESQLYPWSAGSAYEATLDLLIGHGANLEAMGNEGFHTALAWATECGYKTLVELLLSKGAEVNPTTKNRCVPPLYLAAREGYVEIVAMLLESGATVESFEWCALQVAAGNGHEEIVKMLLERTTSIRKAWGYSRESKDWSPLVEASRNGHTGTVEILLTFHERKWPGLPIASAALFWAVYGGYIEIAKMLIKAGVIIDSDPHPYGDFTTLSVAVMRDHKAMVRMLLDSGIDVHINARDDIGWTALTWATRTSNNGEMEDLLLQHGADRDFLKANHSHETRYPLNIDDSTSFDNLMPMGPVSIR